MKHKRHHLKGGLQKKMQKGSWGGVFEKKIPKLSPLLAKVAQHKLLFSVILGGYRDAK